MLPAELSRLVGCEFFAEVLGVVVVDQHERLPDGEGAELLKDLWMLVRLPQARTSSNRSGMTPSYLYM